MHVETGVEMLSEETPRINKSQSTQSNINKSEGSLQKNQQQQIMGKDSESSQSLPTKQDMADMMCHLECMIKIELSATRMDIKNVLQRVEEMEEHLNEHKSAILKLRERAEWEWLTIRNIQYRLEDQENQSRQNNLRIRVLSETIKDSKLETVVQEMFNKILKR